MARDVNDDEKTLIERMLSTLNRRAKRNRVRREFVEMETRLRMPGADIPPEYEMFNAALSWPKKAVSAFAARQIPTGYSLSQPSTLLDDLHALIAEADYDLAERQVIEASDELGCAFVFTTLGDESQGEPPVIFSRRTAMTATAEEDPRTGRVTAALEIVGPDRMNLYLPGVVLECERTPARQWRVVTEVHTGTHRVMCAPYAHDASLHKPMGRSRVSRSVMDLTMAAMRVSLRQEIAGQLFMAPRPFIRGASMDDFQTPADRGGPPSPFSITTGDMWAVEDVSVDDDPDLPDSLRRVDLQMIQQMSMQPFSDNFRLLAGKMSAASSLPPFYLGVMQDSNPTSAQAIEASEIDLVREVRYQEPIIGKGRKTVALNALSLLEGQDVTPSQYPELVSLHADWEDPRTRSMSEQSQMVATQVGAANLQPGTENTLSMLPISPQSVERAAQENQRASGGSILEQIMGGQQDATSEGEADLEEARTMRERFDALGVAIRAGVDPEDAANRLGLSGIKFTGAMPAMLRMPEER